MRLNPRPSHGRGFLTTLNPPKLKGIDRNRHTLLLQALGELRGLTTDDEEETARIKRETTALRESYECYLVQVERLRKAIADYDALHDDLRHRTFLALRTRRRSARRAAAGNHAVIPISVPAQIKYE